MVVAAVNVEGDVAAAVVVDDDEVVLGVPNIRSKITLSVVLICKFQGFPQLTIANNPQCVKAPLWLNCSVTLEYHTFFVRLCIYSIFCA